MRFCMGAENAKMKVPKKVPKRVDTEYGIDIFLLDNEVHTAVGGHGVRFIVYLEPVWLNRLRGRT